MTIFSALPYTLSNGNVADAAQVMADITSLYNDGNANAAHKGANADITSLSGLSTPLSIPQGGTGAIALSGLGRVAAVKIQVFTSSGTYTPTTGLIAALIEAVGGGGGSPGIPAGSAGNICIAGGGGSGAYSRAVKTAAQIGVSQTVTIGAGGAAGTAGANVGGGGGNTSVGALVLATGGNSGQTIGAAAASYVQKGGNGGDLTGALGDVTFIGMPGLPGIGTNSVAKSGDGGRSVFGGGGVGATNGGAGAGTFGAGAGAPAGVGASAATAGAVGGAGIVVITEFLNQ